MTQGALVDTGILVGALNRRDSLHAPALAIVRAIDDGKLGRAIVTDFVLAETLNYVNRKVDGDLARETLRRLLDSAHFVIERTPDTVWNKARDVVFPRYGHLSFTDALVVAHLSQRGLRRLFSFDSGFDAVRGIERLAALPAKTGPRRGNRPSR